MPRSAKYIFAALLAMTLSLSACSTTSDVTDKEEEQNEAQAFWKRVFSKEFYKLYKPEITQGNSSLLDERAIRRLRLGMRREQVEYLVGRPIMPNAFRLDRWTYVYKHIPSHGETVKRHMTLFFDDENRLKNICMAKQCR